jgi:ketosteroid isomerase-like protein
VTSHPTYLWLNRLFCIGIGEYRAEENEAKYDVCASITTLSKGEEMKTGNDKATQEAGIRNRLDAWAKAVRAKDIEGVMSNYAPDNLLFDLAPPLQYRGAEACRRNWAEWFPTFQGPIGYEIAGLQITSSDDVAFCHGLNHISGTRTDGEQTDVWARATFGLRKLNGTWLITHEHYSVPFYMEPPYKAALDLRP